MASKQPTKIRQRKKINLTENIKSWQNKLESVKEDTIIFREKDFSDKFDTAVLVFIADWHLGARHFDLDSAISVLEYVLNTPNALLFSLGDNLNTTILNAVSNMYEDVVYPQEQLDLMVDLLSQIAQQDKLVSYIDGNHERRVYKQTGLSLGKQVTKAIGAEDAYAPYFTGADIVLKCANSPTGSFTFRLTGHHGDGVNFLKMQNLNPGAFVKLVGHWHRFEMNDEVVTILDPETGIQHLLDTKNIKLPNAGKTPFEYSHLEKSRSPYYAIEISSTKNPHFVPNSTKRVKYPEFIPTMKSIPILSVASNKNKDKTIRNIKKIIDQKQNRYTKEFSDKIKEALSVIEKANADFKNDAKLILGELYKSAIKKPSRDNIQE
jgi:uncharacterized membrane protein YfbV (UPF0208 family)